MPTAQGNVIEPDEPLLEGKHPDQDIQYLLDQTDPVEYEDRHDDIVIFSRRNHPHHNYLYPLFAYRLCELDIPTYFFFFHNFISRTFPDLVIDDIQVSNCLRDQQHPYLFRSGQIGYPRFNWEVDLDEGIIKTPSLDDVNFFECFLATIRKDQKRYDIDFTDPEVAMNVQKGLFTLDEVLRHCQLLTKFAKLHDVTVKFIGWETSYLPHGLVELFADSETNQGYIDYIKLGTMYGHYYGDVHDFANKIGVANLTERGTHKQFAGFADEFEEYKSQIQSKSNLLDQVKEELKTDLQDEILGSPLEGVGIGEEQLKSIKHNIEFARDNGNHVFALFGHKFYDVGWYDEGPIFDDMLDWLDRIVDFFEDRGDFLLLKPHPSEINKGNEATEPNITMAEYIEDKYDSDNIALLHPKALKSIAVYEMIDCGLVWRSTVGIEMNLLGEPVIVCGNPYWLDYIDAKQPKTMQEFETMVNDPTSINIDPEIQTQAAVFLHFLKNYRHFYEPYIQNLDYTGQDPRELCYDKKKLEKFFEEGDERIDHMIDEFGLSSFDPEYSVEKEFNNQLSPSKNKGIK